MEYNGLAVPSRSRRTREVGRWNDWRPSPSCRAHAPADTVDWSRKDSLDFNDIRETLLLNLRWKSGLEED